MTANKQLLDQHAEDTQMIGGLALENAKLRNALTGCADMLNECAKQFRKLDQPGHAAMADAYQQAARSALTARAAEE